MRVDIPVGSPISDDSMYFRNDHSTVKAVLDRKQTLVVCFGSRRFGKTSFLRKLERLVQTGRSDYDHVWWHRIEGQNRAGIDAIRNEGIKGAPGKRHLILIDDLMMIEEAKKDVATGVAKALRELCDEVAKTEFRSKIVLCEPTRLENWLYGKSTSKFGTLFHETVVDAEKETYFDISLKVPELWLRGLRPEEATNFIRGSLDDSEIDERLRYVCDDEEFCRDLVNNLGGNPWLLAHARDILARQDVLPDLNDFVPQVADKARKSDKTQTTFFSIINALSDEERFVVQLLYEAGGENGNPSARMLTMSNAAPKWKREGRLIGQRLAAFGLISLADEVPNQIRGDALREAAAPNEAISIILDPSASDLKIWSELIQSPHPTKQHAQPIIIHQLEDLFFDASDSKRRHKAWDAYKAELKRMEKSAYEEERQRRPHLLIFCGNLIRGRDDRPDYVAGLKHALDELLSVVDYLQPLPGADAPESKQIVVVPGLFDLFWDSSNPDSTYEIWSELVEKRKFTFPGAKSGGRFAGLNLDMVLLDTLSLDGAVAAFGKDVATDLVETRAILRNASEWMWKDGVFVGEADKVSREDIARFFMRYTVIPAFDKEFSSRKRKPAPAMIRWQARRSLDQDGVVEARNDSGFVSPADFERVKDKPPPAARGWLRMAITHHCPMDRSPSAATEFHKAYQLRRQLATHGVHFVLHGHSVNPHCLTETVRVKGNDSLRNVHLIGSGGLSSERGQVVETIDPDEGIVEAYPNYNEITIHPPQGPGKPYKIQVQFREIRDGKVSPAVSPSVTVDVDALSASA